MENSKFSENQLDMKRDLSVVENDFHHGNAQFCVSSSTANTRHFQKYGFIEALRSKFSFLMASETDKNEEDSSEVSTDEVHVGVFDEDDIVSYLDFESDE